MSELDLEGLERVARADEDTDVLALVAEVRRLRESGRLIAQTAKNRKAEVHALSAQRDAVLALHRVEVVDRSCPYCHGADSERLGCAPARTENRCADDEHLWPCATARALGVTE